MYMFGHGVILRCRFVLSRLLCSSLTNTAICFILPHADAHSANVSFFASMSWPATVSHRIRTVRRQTCRNDRHLNLMPRIDVLVHHVAWSRSLLCKYNIADSSSQKVWHFYKLGGYLMQFWLCSSCFTVRGSRRRNPPSTHFFLCLQSYRATEQVGSGAS